MSATTASDSARVAAAIRNARNLTNLCRALTRAIREGSVTIRLPRQARGPRATVKP